MYLLNVPQMQSVIEHICIGEDEPVMFHGPPGCGKSEGIAQACDTLGVQLIDIRLGQYESVDLRGLPDLDSDDKCTSWRIPRTLPFIGNPDFDPDKPKLVFLDEANAGRPSVLGSAYQMVQDRAAGEHKFMPNTYIALAGNREGDKGIITKMPMPLNNRITHYEVGPDAKAFVAWASTQPRVPAEMIALLSMRPDLITNFDPTAKDFDPTEKAFVTPRTIFKACKYHTSNAPEEIRDASIEGCVGKDFANWFRAFCKTTADMVPIDEIERDPLGVPVSEKGEVRWMTSVGIGGRMAQEPKSAGQLHKYLKRMDGDFQVLAWQIGVQRNAALLGAPGFVEIAKLHAAVFASCQ